MHNNFTGIGLEVTSDVAVKWFGDGTIAFIPEQVFARFPSLASQLVRVAIAREGEDAQTRTYTLPTKVNLNVAAAPGPSSSASPSPSTSSIAGASSWPLSHSSSTAYYPLSQRLYMSILAEADVLKTALPTLSLALSAEGQRQLQTNGYFG